MKKFTKIISLAFVMLLLVSSVISVSAASTPYKTYTYTMDGIVTYSPAAYVPDREIDYYAMNMDTPIGDATDLFVAPDGKLYIADKGNSRIVVLDKNAQYITELKEFVNEQGVPDKLYECEGVFVNDKNIYICDTKNARIVVFDLEYNFDHIINAPELDVMGQNEKFSPVAMAVDSSGRMYIVSTQTYSGIFAINADGTFQGFVGVQKASVPLATRIRRMLFPNTSVNTYSSFAYNNVSIDSEDFIWATTFGDVTSDEAVLELESKLLGGDADSATVKRLNAAGQDIMIRNGFFMPIGEVNFVTSDTKVSSQAPVRGHSKLVDVALGPNGTWSTIDRDRSRIFTYDSRGQLLYAFGDSGSQLGNLKSPTAIVYVGSDIYVLGQSIIAGRGSVITVFQRTEYGDLIDSAIQYNNERQYDLALEKWKEILQRNNNFDSAYVGIGENLFLKGEYEEAMRYFKAATDTTDYSECFRMLRKAWVEKYFLVVLVVIGVLIFLLVKAFSAIKKKNNAGTTKTGKRTFWEEVLFAFHLIMHPFDGFWDLKHEKRGSVRGAIFYVALASLTVVYSSVGMAYIFNPYSAYAGNGFNFFYSIATVIVPLALWCVANWCITTLFDGEGTLKDIFISTSYSLLPMTLTLIPATLLSNIAVEGEGAMITLVSTLGFIWMGLLIFFGTMTTHGYSMGKNILATLGTILGMLFIMFLIMLFFNLIRRMVGFVTGLIEEIAMQG